MKSMKWLALILLNMSRYAILVTESIAVGICVCVSCSHVSESITGVWQASATRFGSHQQSGYDGTSYMVVWTV